MYTMVIYTYMAKPIPIIDGKRKCSKCKLDVPITDYSVHVRKGKPYYMWCNDCARRGYAKKRGNRWAENLSKIKNEYVNNLKQTTPCADCKNIFNPVAMDFDHVNGIKKYNISQGLRNTISIESLKEEIAKCELVCANCHRVRTFNRKRSVEQNINSSRRMGVRKIMDQNGNLYLTQKEIVKKLDIPYGSVSAVLNGKINSTRGYKFRYIEDSEIIVPEDSRYFEYYESKKKED